MNHTLEELKDAVLAGVSLTREEALDLLRRLYDEEEER